MSNFSDEFLSGQNDCQKGVEHKPNQSEEYDLGYAAQYEIEQIQTEMSV